MPAISNVVRRALSDARITKEEVQQLQEAVRSGAVKGEELATLAQKYGDLFDVGAGKALTAISPPQAHVVIRAPLRSIGDNRAAAEVLCGTRTLSQANAGSKDAVLTFQRALESLSNRMGKPEWSLPSGADGGFGGETTRAVQAFQRDNGLPVTGTIDQMTALSLEHLMMKNAPPDDGGVTGPALTVADGDRIAQAARDLIAARATDYGVGGVWKSPNPSVPGNAKPGVTTLGVKDRWKCNLFGMDSLYAGGAKPPQYPGGNYPIAIEIPNYSRGPDAPLIKLGEVWPGKAGTPEEAQAKIDALLKIARPGDVIIVNHQGTDTSDGGHTRVVVGNNYDSNGTVDCAQASSDAAKIRGETLGSFTGEEAFYLLRPANAR
jgi:peptidoglycan hydrolase-like protein with peptidoglycan-binding domain